MDFEQNNISGPQDQQAGPIGPAGRAEPTPTERPRRHTGWRIFWGVVLVLSVLANIVLLVMLIGVVAFFAIGQRGIFTEELIQAGPRTNKIAVVTVRGIINDPTARDIYQQLKLARRDERVKGLIVRINSPGGTISGSDQIYNEIRKFRHKTDKPVIAFMQGMAASGGYYTSVACEKIVAEPTTVTGSVGVIAGYFVLQGLLEEKLGIEPVIIKSGLKKDWPSPFQPVTEEQRQYIQDKLITPAYERFLQVVDEGRGQLTLDDVKKLADGSIYSAQEALEKKLIDDIGYLDDAIEQAKLLAGVDKARVIEYRKPFSLSDFLSVRSRALLKIDKTTLYELTVPQVLYLWSGY